MTGGGKGMQVANDSPDGKRCSCDDHDQLQPVGVGGVKEQVRWGAFLRAIRPPWCVGDYAHVVARLCNATQKRLGENVSSWAQEGYGRE